MRRLLLAATTAALLLLVANAFAETPEVRVRFRKGTTSTVVKGRVAGYETVDYMIDGRKGQRITVKLTSKNPQAHFMIHSVNGMETQQIETRTFEEVLPEDRDYRIRVSLTRAAARRKGARADFSLAVQIR
jgi:hypothetical protein